MSLSIDIYEADGTTHVATLGSARQREYLDDLSAEGAFSFDIQIGHADEAACTPDRIAQFSLSGTPVWQGFIEECDPVYADPDNRQAGRVIKVRGRGLLALLEDAVVYPELGLGRISPETRYFNFASVDYDDTGWGTATELKQQNDPDNTKAWFGAPQGWVDPNAYWIGPAGSDTPPIAPGDIYFRGTFTVAVGEGTEYRFYVNCDDGHDTYVDGNKAASEQRVGLWGVEQHFELLLDEGTHLIAVKATNFDRPVASTNVFGFIMSVIQLLDGGQDYGLVVSRSSSGTKMLDRPSSPPGMTPGKILYVLLQEMHDRATLPDFGWDFTATEDSDGTPWPNEIDVSFPVNSSYLEVIRHLVDEHACDVAMDPSGLILHAYVSKGTDRTTGGGAVTASYGTSVNKLAFKKLRARKNVGLSKTAEGRWVEASESASVTAHGRREVGMSLGSAPSDAAADRQTAAFFADFAYPVEAITDMQFEDVSATPALDFVVGDTINSTDSTGGTSPYRVEALRVADDPSGSPSPVFTPQLVAP